MSAPLVPLIAGAALGAIATLLYRDKKVSTTLRSKAAEAAGKVSDAALRVKSAMEADGQAEEAEAEDTSVDNVVEAVNGARPADA